jgi:hypothetical protein
MDRGAYVSKKITMNIRKIGHKGNQGLKDAKLYVHSLRHGVRHGIDDQRNCGLWYGFQCNESLQGAQGNSNHFSVLGCTTHEYGLEKIVQLWSI